MSKAVTRILVTAIIVAGIIYLVTYFFDFTGRALRATDDAISRRMKEISNIAGAFHSGTVKTEFRSYTTRVKATNYLQVAHLETSESFTKQRAEIWGPLTFNAEIEINAPVEYVYYVDLEKQDQWHFELFEASPLIGSDSSVIRTPPEVIVRVPQIEWNKPSVNLEELRYRIIESSIAIDEDVLRDGLQREITQKANERAKENISLIREIARAEIKRFTENWIVTVMFRDYQVKPHVVQVYFADEWAERHPEHLSAPPGEIPLPPENQVNEE